MKVRTRFQAMPILEMEGDPEEVAKLLLYLRGAGPETIDQEPLQSKTEPPENKPPPVKQEKQPHKPSVKAQGAPDKAPIERLQGRPYGGSPNRREMVLYCLEKLQAEGQEPVNLTVIRKTFAAEFPEANQSNLDQVVRDLANKTDWVDSPSRGSYSLTEKYQKKHFS